MTDAGELRRSMISAADIGTNTVKITHAAVQANDEIVAIREAANTIRLGKGIEETGRIDPERIATCIAFLQLEERVGQMLGSEAYIGVATETLRIASNGADLLTRIEEETSWRIKVITGKEEARLTYVGLRNVIPAGGDAVIVDIGGGSTEIIVARNDAIMASTSIHLGSGRLADRFFREDPPGIEALMSASAAASEQLAGVSALPDAVDSMLLAGGNGVFIEKLIEQLFPDRPLSAETVEQLLVHFSTTPAQDAADRLEIAPERARVLPAGAAIAFAFLLAVPATTATGVPSGIRSGLIREYEAG